MLLVSLPLLINYQAFWIRVPPYDLPLTSRCIPNAVILELAIMGRYWSNICPGDGVS